MHKRLICVLMLAMTSVFGGAAFGDEVEIARYIMVLRDRYAPSASPAERERPVAEPDLAQFGGRVITARMSRRLIEIPTSAAEELSKHPDVAYLQRLWTSEPPSAPRLQSQSAPARVATTYSETPDWTTGAYSYDGSGNIRGIGSDLYAYDSAARLISSTVNATTSSYHYDAYGNLTSAGAVNAKNQLTSRTYDTAGHMTTDGAGEAYQYDALSMVTGVPSTEGGRRMIYTADEERLAVVTASGSATDETYTIRVRNFRNQVLREFITRTAIGTEWVRDYVYADGRLVAGERQVPVGTSGIRHFHLDHLGSVRLITRGGDAARITEPKYAPFGQEIRSSRDEAKLVYTPLEPLKFTGHERDYTGPENLEDGDYLDYMHARYYDAEVGRFLSVDPVIDRKAALKSPQMWNRYGYVHNNPVKKIDPDGRLAYHWHYWITYKAARDSGMSRRESMSLAWNVVKVDHRKGSQGKDAWASNLHAMRGTKDDGRTQTIKEGRDGIQASIAGSLYFSDLAAAIHTAQDLAAPMHADRAWKGAGVNATTIMHLKGDVAPEPGTIGLAYVNTMNVIKTDRERAAGSMNLSPTVYSGTTVDDEP